MSSDAPGGDPSPPPEPGSRADLDLASLLRLRGGPWSTRSNKRDEAEAAAWAESYEAGDRLARGAGIPDHACGCCCGSASAKTESGPEEIAGDRIPLESRLIRAARVCESALSRRRWARRRCRRRSRAWRSAPAPTSTRVWSPR